MRVLVLVVILGVVRGGPIERGARRFGDRPKLVGDIDGSVSGEYAYVDSNGATHHVKYEAGPKIGFKIIEDKILEDTEPPTPASPTVKSPVSPLPVILPGVEQEETIRVHHLRNEVPADVHRTQVPDIVHFSIPPPVKPHQHAPAGIKAHPVNVHRTTVPDIVHSFNPPPFKVPRKFRSGRTAASVTILPEAQEEVVRVHHLRNEVPADVHRTQVPDIVHSSIPPPVRPHPHAPVENKDHQSPVNTRLNPWVPEEANPEVINRPSSTSPVSPFPAILLGVEQDETVRVHHLRNEVPADVHRTQVPDIVHSSIPPPVKPHQDHTPFSPLDEEEAAIVSTLQESTPVDQDETVKVHHLRNEVPANVHRTTVPAIVHSNVPPPIKGRVKKATVHRYDGTIDGLTPEQAANYEAQYAYMQALNLLLPQIQQIVKEQGEIVIPVHHVHHVHSLGHIQASPAQTTVHSIRVTHRGQGLHVEHLGPTTFHRRFLQDPVEPWLVQTEVPEKEKALALASEVSLMYRYAPEVWQARQARLVNYAGSRLLLPPLEYGA